MMGTVVHDGEAAVPSRLPHMANPDDGTGRARWSDWSTSVEIAVTDPDALERAVRMARIRMDAVSAACSRFDPDSELMRAARSLGRTVRISQTCAGLVRAALRVAAATAGTVTPVMGGQLAACGYRVDISRVRSDGDGTLEIRPAASWRDVRLDGDRLFVPSGIVLDLGATAKAATADWIARRIRAETGAGAYVELGGDIATAGAEPDGGWQVLV